MCFPKLFIASNTYLIKETLLDKIQSMAKEGEASNGSWGTNQTIGTVDLANNPMQNLLNRFDDVSRRTLDHLEIKDQPKHSPTLRNFNDVDLARSRSPLKANVHRYDGMRPPLSKPPWKVNLGNFSSGTADFLRDLYSYKDQVASDDDAPKMPELVLDRNYPLRRLLADTTGPRNYHQEENGSGGVKVDTSTGQDREHNVQTGKHFGSIHCVGQV